MLVDDVCHMATAAADHDIPAAPGFDISNPAVAIEFIGRIQRWLGRNGTGLAPYGALSIDTVFLANYYGGLATCNSAGGCGECELSTAWDAGDGGCGSNGWGQPQVQLGDAGVALNGAQGFDPAYCVTTPGYAGYCDPAWTQMVLNWISRLRDEAHKLNLNLVVNVGYAGSAGQDGGAPAIFIPPNDPSLTALFGIVDGVLDEEGFTWDTSLAGRESNECAQTWMVNDNLACGPACGTYACGDGGTTCTSCDRWSDYGILPGSSASFPNGGYMRAVQALGKAYFNKNDSPDMADGGADGGAFLWSLASHLMARGATASTAYESIYLANLDNDIGYASSADPSTSSIYDALAAYEGIGFPCQDAVVSGDVFTRMYSGGYVIVNAGGNDAGVVASVPLPSGVSWAGSGGDGGITSVSVPPMTGVVELPVSGSLACTQGSACTAGDRCGSGFCTSGYCCNTSCEG